MFETLKDITIALIFAGVCAILALVFKNYKQNILNIATNLIKQAEEAVQGSSLGEEKKQKVIAQLEATGISVNKWLDKQIDQIVKSLNEKSAWFTSEANSTTSTAIDSVVQEVIK